MNDVLVATLTVQNSRSLFQVAFEFGECTLQTQMLDHMSTLLGNFADTLLSFGHRKGGKYANCGAIELQKFKEEVIQKYLGVPKERFGNSPRESDLEVEDLPGLVPMTPRRSRLSDRRSSIPDLTAMRYDSCTLDSTEPSSYSRLTTPEDSTGPTGVSLSNASNGTNLPRPAPTSPPAGTGRPGLTQRFWNYFRKKEASEVLNQPGSKVESTPCFVLPHAAPPVPPVPSSGDMSKRQMLEVPTSPWR